MTSLLSIILSLLLAFSGGGEILDVPTTATQLTLSDVTVTVDDETVMLNPEAVLSLALGANEAAATFAIRNGADTYAPMHATLTNDRVTFSVCDGKLYTMDSDAFEALVDEDGEIRTALAQYLHAANAEYVTAGNMSDFSRQLQEFLNEKITLTEESNEVPLGGALCKTEVYEGTMTLNDLSALFNSANAENGEPFSAIAGAYIGLIDSDDTEEENVDLLDIRIETAENGDELYFDFGVSSADMEAVPFGFDLSWIGGETDGVFELAAEIAEGDTDLAIGSTMQLASPSADNINVDFDFFISDAQNTDFDGEEGDGLSATSGSVITMTGVSATNDGLNSFDVDIGVDREFAFVISAEEEDDWNYDYSESFASGMEYSETANEDGAIEGRFAFDIKNDDECFGISCTLTREEVPFDAAALTEGRETVALKTENDMVQLLADGAAVASDFMKLAEEPSIKALTEIAKDEMTLDDDEFAFDDDDFAFDDDEFGFDEDEIAFDDDAFDFDEEEFELDDEFSLDEYLADEFDFEYEPMDYEQLPLADALARFAGTKVNFTAPESYVEAPEDSAVFEDSYICVVFRDAANDKEIMLSLTSAPEFVDYHYTTVKADGTTADISDPVVSYNCTDEGCDAAFVMLGDTVVDFYFTPCTLEEARAIVSGLTF